MKPAPTFPPKTFHRIRPPVNPKALEQMVAARTSGIVSEDLALEFRRGDGLVVASWDGFGPGRVEALGVVIGIDAAGRRQVEWVSVQFEIPLADRPRPGGQFWSQAKPTFKFADGVAEEFGLKQSFAKHMTDPFAALRETAP